MVGLLIGDDGSDCGNERWSSPMQELVSTIITDLRAGSGTRKYQQRLKQLKKDNWWVCAPQRGGDGLSEDCWQDSRLVIVGTQLLSGGTNQPKRKIGQRKQDAQPRKKRMCQLCKKHGSSSHQIECKKSNPKVHRLLCVHCNEDGSLKPRVRS